MLDSFAALEYVSSPAGSQKFNINPTRASIDGVSAGANIELILAYLARDAAVLLKFVAVGTPAVDDLSKYSSAKESTYLSMAELEFEPILNWPRLKWFDVLKWLSLSSDPAIKEKQMKDVSWFADLMQALNFKGLPETVIYTIGRDLLRDEGEAYARRLVEAGNEVTMKRFEKPATATPR